VQDVIATALGGEMVTTTVEGRERFGVIGALPRELRDDPDAIARDVLVPTMNGAMIPLGQLARVSADHGRPRDPHRERAAGGLHLCRHPRRDLGGYVERAQQAVAEQVSSRRATTRPGAGSSSTWSAPAPS
jgi:Cu(I)/Ag(I) efflux system membrane protein CusA/SilA